MIHDLLIPSSILVLSHDPDTTVWLQPGETYHSTIQAIDPRTPDSCYAGSYQNDMILLRVKAWVPGYLQFQQSEEIEIRPSPVDGPWVLVSSPAEGQDGVSSTPPIRIVFDQIMDTTTGGPITIVRRDRSTGSFEQHVVEYAWQNSSAVSGNLAPGDSLGVCKVYTLSVPHQFRNRCGAPLDRNDDGAPDGYTATFRTVTPEVSISVPPIGVVPPGQIKTVPIYVHVQPREFKDRVRVWASGGTVSRDEQGNYSLTVVGSESCKPCRARIFASLNVPCDTVDSLPVTWASRTVRSYVSVTPDEPTGPDENEEVPPPVEFPTDLLAPTPDMRPYVGILSAPQSPALQAALFDAGVPSVEVDFNTDSMKFEVLGISWIPFDSLRVLFIPTDGLVSFQNVPAFATNLQDFVSRGGVLVVFSQKNSQAYEVLPRASELTVTGWDEERQCASSQTYFDTWHPLSCGFGFDRPYIAPDGSVVEAPPDAVWMVRKVTNAQGAAVIYPFGQGHVVIAPGYPDWDYARGRLPAFTQRWLAGLAFWGFAPQKGHEIQAGQSASNLPYTLVLPGLPVHRVVPFVFFYSWWNLRPDTLWLDTLVVSGSIDSLNLLLDIPPGLPAGVYPVNVRLLGAGDTLLRDVPVGWLAVRSPNIQPGNPWGSPVRAWFTVRSQSDARIGDTLWLHVKNLSDSVLTLHTGIGMWHNFTMLMDTIYTLAPGVEVRFPVKITLDLPRILGRGRIFEALVSVEDLRVYIAIRVNVSLSLQVHTFLQNRVFSHLVPFTFRFVTDSPLDTLPLQISVRAVQEDSLWMDTFFVMVDTPGIYTFQDTLWPSPPLSPGKYYRIEPSVLVDSFPVSLTSAIVVPIDPDGARDTLKMTLDSSQAFLRVENLVTDSGFVIESLEVVTRLEAVDTDTLVLFTDTLFFPQLAAGTRIDTLLPLPALPFVLRPAWPDTFPPYKRYFWTVTRRSATLPYLRKSRFEIIRPWILLRDSASTTTGMEGETFSSILKIRAGFNRQDPRVRWEEARFLVARDPDSLGGAPDTLEIVLRPDTSRDLFDVDTLIPWSFTLLPPRSGLFFPTMRVFRSAGDPADTLTFRTRLVIPPPAFLWGVPETLTAGQGYTLILTNVGGLSDTLILDTMYIFPSEGTYPVAIHIFNGVPAIVDPGATSSVPSPAPLPLLPSGWYRFRLVARGNPYSPAHFGQHAFILGWTDSIQVDALQDVYLAGQSPTTAFSLTHHGPDLPARISLTFLRNAEGVRESTLVLDGWNYVDQYGGVHWDPSRGWVIRDSAETWSYGGFSVDLLALAKSGSPVPAPSRLERFRRNLALHTKGSSSPPPRLNVTYSRVLVAPEDSILTHLLVVGDTSRLLTFDDTLYAVIQSLTLDAGGFEDFVRVGGFLFASQPDSGRVLKFSVNPLAILDTLVFNQPTGLGIFNNELLVTERGTGRIYRLDPATGVTIRSYTGFSAPVDADQMGNRLVVSDTAGGGTLALVDTSTGTPVRALASGVFLQVLAGHFGEVFAYAADSGRFLVFDTLGNAIPFDGGPAVSGYPHWARGVAPILLQGDLDLSWGTYATVDRFEVKGGLTGEVLYRVFDIGTDLLEWLEISHTDHTVPGTSVDHRFRYDCAAFKHAELGTWYPLDSLLLLSPASDSACPWPSTDLEVHVRLTRVTHTTASPVCPALALTGLFRSPETRVWDTLWEDTLTEGFVQVDTLLPPPDSFPEGDYRVDLTLESTDSLGLLVAQAEDVFRVDSSGVVARFLPGPNPVWPGESLTVLLDLQNLSDSLYSPSRLRIFTLDTTFLDTLLDLPSGFRDTFAVNLTADSLILRAEVRKDTLLLSRTVRIVEPESVGFEPDTVVVPDTVGADTFEVSFAGTAGWVTYDPFEGRMIVPRGRDLPVRIHLAFQDTTLQETLLAEGRMERTWHLVPTRPQSDTLRISVITPNDTFQTARVLTFSPQVQILLADSVVSWSDTVGTVGTLLQVAGRPDSGWMDLRVLAETEGPPDTIVHLTEGLLLAPDTIYWQHPLALMPGDYTAILRMGTGGLELDRDSFRIRVRLPYPVLLSWWVDSLADENRIGVHAVLENPVPRPLSGEIRVSYEAGEADSLFTLDSLARDTLTLWLPPAPRPDRFGLILQLLEGGVPYLWDGREVFFRPIFQLTYPETLHATMGDRIVIPFTLTNHGTAYAFDTLRWVWGENEEFRVVSLWPGDTLQDSLVVFLPPAFVSAVERPYFELAGQTWIMTLRVEGLAVEDSFFVPPAARVGDTVQIRAVLENRSIVPFRGFLTFRYHMQETTLVLELSGQKIGFVPVDTALVPQDTPAVWISPVLADTVDSVRVSLFGDSLQHVTVDGRRVDTLTPWMPPESLFSFTAYQVRLRLTGPARVDSLVLHRYRGGVVRDTLISTFPSPSDTFVWAFGMDTAGPTQDVYLEVDHESGRGVLWTSRKIQVATDSLMVYPERPRYGIGDTLRLVVQTLRPETLFLDPGVLGETLRVPVPVGSDTVPIGRVPPLVSASYPVGYRGVYGDTGRVWVDVEGFKVGVMELRAQQGPPESLGVWMRIRSEHRSPDSLQVRLQLVQDDTVSVLDDTVRAPFQAPEMILTHRGRLSGGHNGMAQLAYELFALPERLRLASGMMWISLSGLDHAGPVVTGTRVDVPDDTTQPVRLALAVEDESPVSGWFLVRRDTVWDTLQATVYGDTLAVQVSGGDRRPVAWFAWLVDADGNTTRWPSGTWPETFGYFRRPVELTTQFERVVNKRGDRPVLLWRHPGEEVVYARGVDERWIVVDTARTVDVVLLPSQLPAVIEEIRFFGVSGRIRAEILVGDSLRAAEEREFSREGWKAIPFHVEITDTPVVLRFRGAPDGVLGFVNADRKVVLTGGIAGTPLLAVRYRYPVLYRVERERLAPVPGAVRIWPALTGSPLADTLPGEGMYHYTLSLVLPDTTKSVDGEVVTVEREGPWVGYVGSVLDTSSQIQKISRFRVWDASGVRQVVGLIRDGRKWEEVEPLAMEGDTVAFALPLGVDRMWVEAEDRAGHRIRRGPFYPVIHGLSGVLRDTTLTGWVFVTGDVTIPESVRVVLQGAWIVHAPGDGEQSGWNRTRIEWVVRGQLQGRDCRFLSGGEPEAWGIRAEGGRVVLRNCEFTGGSWGVYGWGEGVLEGSRFGKQERAVGITGGTWVLRGNRFEEVGTALVLAGSGPSDRMVLRQNRVERARVGIRVDSWNGAFWADLYRSPGEFPAGLNAFFHTDTVLINRSPQPLFFGGNFLGTVTPDSLDTRVVDDEEGVGGPVEVLPTYTMGGVEKDTTLCHPLLLAGDWVIPEGVRVTVCPGFAVYALAGYDMSRAGNDADRVELIVRGELGVEPAHEKREGLRLVFASDRWAPQSGDWAGIRIRSPVDLELSGWKVVGAMWGLEVQSAGKAPIAVTLRDMVFEHTGTALDLRNVRDFGVEGSRVVQAETVLVAGSGRFEGNVMRECKAFVVHTGKDTLWARWNDWGVYESSEIARRILPGQGVVIWEPWLKPGEVVSGVQTADARLEGIRVVGGRGAIRVVWSMEEPEPLVVRVFDVLGREVGTRRGRVRGQGRWEWKVPPGVYSVEVIRGERRMWKVVIPGR